MITNLTDQLKRDEGLKLFPYKDSVGKTTIGIGRNLDDDGISEAEADLLLANDIQHATVALEAEFPWTSGLDAIRKGALVNMTFNMGIRGLAEFHNFLSYMQANQWQQASAEMLNSLWAKQVGTRAQRLSIQIQTGEWQ